jgi:rhodanese-related sulfurtransferase
MEEVSMMRNLSSFLLTLIIFISHSAYADDEVDKKLAKQIHNAVKDAAAKDHFQIDATTLALWIKEKRKNFQVLDVRMGEGTEKQFKEAHIPGAILIPYTELFKPENLKKLDKKKKIILVCHMGATEELVVVPLRMLGYDAQALLMGMAGWQKDYPMQGWVKGLLKKANEGQFKTDGTKKEIPKKN